MQGSSFFGGGHWIPAPQATETIVLRSVLHAAHCGSPGFTPHPLRRKHASNRWQPLTRGGTIHGLLIFVTLVLVIDGLVGEKGLMETLRARQLLPRSCCLARPNARRKRRPPRTGAPPAEDPSAISSRRQGARPHPAGEMLFILRRKAAKA